MALFELTRRDSLNLVCQTKEEFDFRVPDEGLPSGPSRVPNATVEFPSTLLPSRNFPRDQKGRQRGETILALARHFHGISGFRQSVGWAKEEVRRLLRLDGEKVFSPGRCMLLRWNKEMKTTVPVIEAPPARSQSEAGDAVIIEAKTKLERQQDQAKVPVPAGRGGRKCGNDSQKQARHDHGGSQENASRHQHVSISSG